MLGELVRDLRGRMDASQEDIAKLSRGEFSSAWLCRLELGKFKSPDPRKLRALAKVLNVESNELLIAAGYIKRDGDTRSMSEMSTRELMDHVQRFLNEVSRRQETLDQPVRLDDRRDGTDPSVRRSARTRIGELQAVR